MIVGINYPWLHYDWDFGDPPRNSAGAPWGPRAEWQEQISTVLTSFRQLGIFTVRWFILCSGLAYGTGREAPIFRTGGWKVPTVPKLDELVVADFRALLKAFSQAPPMQLMPVFVDFHMFQDPPVPSGSFPGDPAGFDRSGFPAIKGGRYELISDSTKRTEFLQNALLPLLKAAADYKEAIYAFDLINEPEWCVRNPGKGVPGGGGRVERTHMLSFLREGVSMINRTGLKSSVGFANYATLDQWNSVGLDVHLHQFHYYSDPPKVPRHVFHQRWPIIVGEFASAVHCGWRELSATEQPPPGHDIVYNRLHHLERKGYPAAFIWSAQSKPSEETDCPKDSPRKGQRAQPVDWGSGTQRQVQRFTTGLP